MSNQVDMSDPTPATLSPGIGMMILGLVSQRAYYILAREQRVCEECCTSVFSMIPGLYVKYAPHQREGDGLWTALLKKKPD